MLLSSHCSRRFISLPRTTNESGEDKVANGFSSKVLHDLQRFLGCQLFLSQSKGSCTLSQQQLKEIKGVVAVSSQFSARCQLLFRANNRLRTGCRSYQMFYIRSELNALISFQYFVPRTIYCVIEFKINSGKCRSDIRTFSIISFL